MRTVPVTYPRDIPKDIPLLIINGKKDGITIDHKIFAFYNAELRGFIAKKLDNKGFSAISI